ncbi:MAG: biotin/lipoyl-containing protein [Acidobacteriota bacterium]
MAGRVDVRLGDTILTMAVRADGSVEHEGRTYAVSPAGPGLYRVSDGASQWTIAVAGPADDCWVWVDGRTAAGAVTPAGSGRPRRRSAGDAGMMAPMPATVVNVLVTPGATVAKGDTVVLLEAMKMELPVRAPRDGIVTAVRCTAGKLVQPGVALVELE